MHVNASLGNKKDTLELSGLFWGSHTPVQSRKMSQESMGAEPTIP